MNKKTKESKGKNRRGKKRNALKKQMQEDTKKVVRCN